MLQRLAGNRSISHWLRRGHVPFISNRISGGAGGF
jgi:hypothetical protein